MENKYLKSISILITLLILILLYHFTYVNVYSLINREDEITFTGFFVGAIGALPFVMYVIPGSLYLSITKKSPKFHKITMRFVGGLMIVSVILIPFFSIYITYKLTHEGYVVCEKISWMSPNTFVKAPATCD